MKKLFVILMVSVFGISAYAQDETVIQIQNSKGPYITAGIWDNWFVTAGGGIQVYFGESDTHGDFSDRIAPALDISVGKYQFQKCPVLANGIKPTTICLSSPKPKHFPDFVI